MGELGVQNGIKRVVRSPLEGCPSHVASAPWPCDLTHLCKLIIQLHLGLERENRKVATLLHLATCGLGLSPHLSLCPALLWVTLLSHLTLLCSPALAKSPKASDVLVPHTDPPLKGFLTYTGTPPGSTQGLPVGGVLSTEKTFSVGGGREEPASASAPLASLSADSRRR